MANLTKQELRTKVLQTIGRLAAGETPSAEDAELVEGAIDAIFGELTKFGGASFTPSQIPEWAQDALRDRAAFSVAPSFGIPGPRIAELAQLAANGLALLLRHATALAEQNTKLDLRNKVLQHLGAIRPGEITPASHAETVTDGIDHVFDWWAQRGSLGFTATTIPDWSMLFLRDVVAYRVALVLGVRDATALTVLKAGHDVGIAELDSRMGALVEADTRNQLRNQILQHLGILGPAELATAAQKDLLHTTIKRVFSQLQIHGVITFSETTIPDWAMIGLRDYCAAIVAPSLGIRDPGRLADLAMKQQLGMYELKKQQAGSLNGEPIVTVYY